MVAKCQEFAKLAKSAEKANRADAIELYIQAAQCFDKVSKIKEKNTYLEKAANLYKEIARLSETPTAAFDNYQHSSELQTELGNQKEAQKVMREGYQNYLNIAEKIRTEAKKIKDMELLEQRLTLASKYALEGKDEQLSNDCWIDLGDQIREVGLATKNPREAFEIFNRAISYYRKAKDKTKEYVTLNYAARKFNEIADKIYMNRKKLIEAFDNYLQAEQIYLEISGEEKAKVCKTKVREISEIIGMSHKALTDFLRGTKEIKTHPKDAIFPTDEIEVLLQKSGKLPTETQISIEPLNKARSAPKIGNESKLNKIINEDIKIKDLSTQTQREKSSAPFFEDPNFELKSNEELKKRIKEEIRHGHKLASIDEKHETKKTKEIVKLFDDVLNDLKEDISTKLEDPTPVKKSIDHVPVKPTFNDSINNLQRDNKIESVVMENPSSEVGVYKPVRKEQGIDITQDKKETTLKSLPSTMNDSVARAEFSDSHDTITRELANKFPLLEELTVEKSKDKPIISGPIIDIFFEQGYINQKIPTYQDLLLVPEYEILLIIIAEHPIKLEQIEKNSKIESISLVLSNLQADGLIAQTNDYRWTISNKVRDNLQDPSSPITSQEVDKNTIERLRSRVKRGSKLDDRLISTVRRIGIIPDRDQTITTLMQNPEFAIIRTIKDNEPVELDGIKDKVDHIPRVQLNRVLSRLDIEGWISKIDDNSWQLSDLFIVELMK